MTKYLSKCFLAFVVRHLCRFLGAGDINVTLRFTKLLLPEYLSLYKKALLLFKIWESLSLWRKIFTLLRAFFCEAVSPTIKEIASAIKLSRKDSVSGSYIFTDS